jgi:hypothetical protein
MAPNCAGRQQIQAVQDVMSCLADTLDDKAAGLAELIRKLA